MNSFNIERYKRDEELCRWRGGSWFYEHICYGWFRRKFPPTSESFWLPVDIFIPPEANKLMAKLSPLNRSGLLYVPRALTFKNLHILPIEYIYALRTILISSNNINDIVNPVFITDTECGRIWISKRYLDEVGASKELKAQESTVFHPYLNGRFDAIQTDLEYLSASRFMYHATAKENVYKVAPLCNTNNTNN
jgi:hypothetical protein